MVKRTRVSDEEALAFHSMGRPGKLEITVTKPMGTQRDLALAYSPGVAAPVRAIAENPDAAYDYTAKGNLVAVISNGTAILGLGDLGALASKPVMEGKCALFKRFADVDAIDLEVDAHDPEELIRAIRVLGPSFGGINLEDIKAPECFIIEQRLREDMDIPVFHDDQHGTAIICAAGLINALHIARKKIDEVRIVLNGAGAAGLACIELIKAMGAKPENCIICDTKGVVYRGRLEGMNQWKSAHAVETSARSLTDALEGADVFLGVSAKGALSGAMLKAMARNPIIFAMANPDPEITPEEAHEVRPDAIVATGRSDYPNQVNNVLGFPYIFRGALDVRARSINDEMKIAAANALAELAREDVPDEVAAAYGRRLQYGPDYIIPAPFDPRLISRIPLAVAVAAMESGVARRPIIDIEAYEKSLKARLDPTTSMLQALYERVLVNPKRMVFAEGEEERVMRAAIAYARGGYGEAILIGREERVRETLTKVGLEGAEEEITILNAALSDKVPEYTEYLYKRLQRKGFLHRDCQRMIQQDRNIFSAAMVALGDADGMVTGLTRKTAVALDAIQRAIDGYHGKPPVGVSILLARGRTVLIADTVTHDAPSAEDLANISESAAWLARRLGLEPRVALLAQSTFGYPDGEPSRRMREAAEILAAREVDFEADGDMAVDVALNMTGMAAYPFSRLTGPANVLIAPDRHGASIAAKMLREIGGCTMIGPILVGLEHSAQIASMTATVSEILNMAILAASPLD
ncbi:NADP-dependent malic enzyme [Neomegalonema perideroedes]|uniref:NADP-dependent malic enzyme n=1 Tax=Neomegalonema perideroedes TaxID=217219 RepID=UPI0003631B16|nr:NADP-dependent malic enzyme [Neomegalonema perideroedes]